MPDLADDVRTRVLREATRLFARDGVGATSIQDVAAAAGIRRPTLIYHFGSKEGLRQAVLSTLVDHWSAELPRLMASAASGGPRIDALLRALFGYFLEDRDRARLVLREMIDAPEPVRDLVRTRLGPWMRLLSEALRAGQIAGTLRPNVDPEAFILLMVTSGVGVLAAGDRVNALLDPEPTLEAQLDELVRVARCALLKPPPAEEAR